jgi:cytochrome c oxidase subunit 2
MRFRALTLKVLASAGAAALAAGLQQAFAAPVPGGIELQPAATLPAEHVHDFHNLLLWIISAVTVFVMILLLWVIIRYNSKANPVPKKFSHNTLLEILWTAVPVLILVFIAYRSFPLLYEQDQFPKEATAANTVDIKVIGRQWYWTYMYGTTEEAPSIDSNMLAAEALQPNQIPRLSVDNPLVVPAGKYIRISLTASDVIHAWAIPAFTIKTDAVPGRINQMWFKVDRPGIFYGQCSELCGRQHSAMPIEVRVLSQADFDQWFALMQQSKQQARDFLFRVQPEPARPQVAAN